MRASSRSAGASANGNFHEDNPYAGDDSLRTPLRIDLDEKWRFLMGDGGGAVLGDERAAGEALERERRRDLVRLVARH